MVRVVILSTAVIFASASMVAAQGSSPATAANGVNPVAVEQAKANYEAQLEDSRAASAVSGGLQLQAGSPLQSDNCSVPYSGASGSIKFSLTFVIGHADGSCRAIREMWAIKANGYKAAAIQRLCALKEVHEAMKRAGTPCELQTAHNLEVKK